MYHRRRCSTSLYRSDQQLMSDMLRVACNLLLLQGCFGPFRGAVAKQLRKANISHVVVFVQPFDRPSVKVRRDFRWTDFS